MNTLQVNAITLRNKLIEAQREVHAIDTMTALELMWNNTYQAALNVLDPDAPCFIDDTEVQTLVYLGARQLVSNAMQEARAKAQQRRVADAQLTETEQTLNRLYGPGSQWARKQRK